MMTAECDSDVKQVFSKVAEGNPTIHSDEQKAIENDLDLSMD